MPTLIQDLQLQLDEAAGPVFWTMEQIYDAANAASLEVWTNLKDWQRTSTSVVISSGSDLIALPTTTIMVPQFFVYDGIKIFPTTMALLQDWANNWKEEQLGRPNWFALWDESNIRMFPKADTAYTFTLWGVPWPAEFAAGTHDQTGIDPLVKRAITLRAAANLFEATLPDLADAKMAEAEEWEKRYARQQRNALGDNFLRLRPGLAWDVAQNGDIKTGRLFMGNQS